MKYQDVTPSTGKIFQMEIAVHLAATWEENGAFFTFASSGPYNAESMKKLETKDAAKLLDLTPDMIRKMENKGILRAEKTESGTRLFERRDVERLAKERAKKR